MNVQYSISELCVQLGIGNGEHALGDFIKQHAPIDSSTRIYEAGFWNASQRNFLQHAITEDAEWSYAVDELDVLLRHKKHAKH